MSAQGTGVGLRIVVLLACVGRANLGHSHASVEQRVVLQLLVDVGEQLLILGRGLFGIDLLAQLGSSLLSLLGLLLQIKLVLVQCLNGDLRVGLSSRFVGKGLLNQDVLALGDRLGTGVADECAYGYG